MTDSLNALSAAQLKTENNRLRKLLERLTKGLHAPNWCWNCGYREGHRTGCAVKAALDVLHPEQQEWKRENRILWNERDKSIDEIVIHDIDTLHVEQMSDSCWWMGISISETPEAYWAGNFYAAPRRTLNFSEQEMWGFEWDEDEEHKR